MAVQVSNFKKTEMPPAIINRGRGPEIQGTRITVYRIFDYVRDNISPKHMAAELNLTDAQVQAALDYIAAHREQVEAEYERILERVSQPNPAWIEAGLAKSPEELKQRLAKRRSRDLAGADRSR